MKNWRKFKIVKENQVKSKTVEFNWTWKKFFLHSKNLANADEKWRKIKKFELNQSLTMNHWKASEDQSGKNGNFEHELTANEAPGDGENE